MEQFRKKTVHFASSDEGVKVAELITLVDNNPLAKEILKLLDVKSILGEIIQIPGSRDLVKIQNAINQKYHKEDLESDLNSIYNPQIEMFARFKMKSSFHKTKRII